MKSIQTYDNKLVSDARTIRIKDYWDYVGIVFILAVCVFVGAL